MTNWLRVGLGAGVCLLFVGIFVVAGGSVSGGWGPAVSTPTPEVTKRGNYGRYLYGLTDLGSENKKMAQFDPTLPPDDAVVVEALKVLAKDGFGVEIGVDVQPAVETINETNYITFVVGKQKLLFELFRNSSGQVGTVRFWIGL